MAAYMHPIVAFYDSRNGFPYDRHDFDTTLDRVLKYSDTKLERKHDFIQHLFPTPEPSGFNSEATTLTAEVTRAFREQQGLRDNLRRSFVRMMEFWGFTVTITQGEVHRCPHSDPNAPPPDGENQLEIIPRPEFAQKARQTWLRSHNHNQLRINRMIRSLRILGLEREAHYAAAMFLSADLEANNIVNDTTLQIWVNTAMRDLAHPPPTPAYHRLVDQHLCEWLTAFGPETYTRDEPDYTVWTYQYPVLVRRSAGEDTKHLQAVFIERDGRKLERLLPETTTYGQLYAEVHEPKDDKEEKLTRVSEEEKTKRMREEESE